MNLQLICTSLQFSDAILLRLNETLKYFSLQGDISPHGINRVYPLPFSLRTQANVQINIGEINIGLATTDCIWVMLGHYLPMGESLHCIYGTTFTW